MGEKQEITASNAAKMREALTRVRKMSASYINCHDDEIDRVMTKIVATCDSALAAPRNCDVGTAEEQDRRHEAFCDATRNGMSGYHCDNAPRCVFCFSEWAQMPYEEGVGK